MLTVVTVPSKSPVERVSNRMVGEEEDSCAAPLKVAAIFPKLSKASKVTWVEGTPAVTV